MIFYKIRNGEGKFSTGGSWPDWTKNGKSWSGVGPLKQHLSLLLERRDVKIRDDWEIVVYEMEPVEKKRTSLKNFIRDEIL